MPVELIYVKIIEITHFSDELFCLKEEAEEEEEEEEEEDVRGIVSSDNSCIRRRYGPYGIFKRANI